MTQPWICVFQSDIEYKAEIVRSYLENKNMVSIIIPKKDSIYHIGDYQVHVPQNQVVDALFCINNEITFTP